MLWLTTVNPTINKGTKERLLGHLKKMLRFGLGGETISRAYLWKNPGDAAACVVQKWRKTLVFVPEGSVITHHTSLELLSKILQKLSRSRIRLDSVEELVEFQGNEWKLRFLGGDSVDRFQYTSTTELKSVSMREPGRR